MGLDRKRCQGWLLQCHTTTWEFHGNFSHFILQLLNITLFYFFFSSTINHKWKSNFFYYFTYNLQHPSVSLVIPLITVIHFSILCSPSTLYTTDPFYIIINARLSSGSEQIPPQQQSIGAPEKLQNTHLWMGLDLFNFLYCPAIYLFYVIWIYCVYVSMFYEVVQFHTKFLVMWEFSEINH